MDDGWISYGIVWKSPMDRFHYCKSGNLGIHGDMLWDIHYTYMHCMYNQPQLLGHQIDSISRFNREHDD
jgi:hypothetical protein